VCAYYCSGPTALVNYIFNVIARSLTPWGVGESAVQSSSDSSSVADALSSSQLQAQRTDDYIALARALLHVRLVAAVRVIVLLSIMRLSVCIVVCVWTLSTGRALASVGHSGARVAAACRADVQRPVCGV
jgi:hypothetical protein